MSRLTVGSLVLAALVSSVVLVGCPVVPPGIPAPPEALFEARPDSGHLPLTVQFLNESKAGTSPIRLYRWDFGDGTTSNLPNPTHTYYEAGRYSVTLSVTTAVGASTRTLGNCVEVTEPSTVAGLDEAGGSVGVDGTSLTAAPGTFAGLVVVGIASREGTVRTNLSEGEILVSDVFSIFHDQADLFIDPRDKLTLQLPFVAANVPEENRDAAHVQILAQLDNGLVVPILGEVGAGHVTATLGGFPAKACYAVVYRPQAVLDTLNVDELAKVLMPYRWNTNAWRLSYTAMRLQELTALRVGNLVSVRSYDRRDWPVLMTNETLGEIVDTVAGQHVDLRDAGFISPALVSSPDAQYDLIFYPMNDVPVTDYERVSETAFGTTVFGSVVIDPAQLIAISRRNAGEALDQQQELEFPNAMAQTFFRAIFRGYDYAPLTAPSPSDHGKGVEPLAVAFAQGFEDGVATYLGQVFDGIGRPRSLGANEYSLLSEPLFAPFSIVSPAYSYASQDFLFYVTNRFGAGDALSYIADSYEGILELIRVRTGAAGVDDFDDAWTESRVASDIALDRFFGEPLSDVYWEFAQARAYLNPESSFMRLSDYQKTPFTLNEEQFAAGSLIERTFLSPGVSVEISGDTQPALASVPPLSTRVFVLRAGGGLDGDLRVGVNAYEWVADTAGRTMNVLVYKAGESEGIALDAFDSRITLPGFGSDDAENGFDTVIVLASNVSLTRSYPLTLTAMVQAEGGGGSTGAIHGLVSDSGTVTPLGDAAVTVRQIAGGHVGGIVGSTLTDVEGQYALTDLPVGAVEVSFTKSGYTAEKVETTILANQDITMNVSMDPSS